MRPRLALRRIRASKSGNALASTRCCSKSSTNPQHPVKPQNIQSDRFSCQHGCSLFGLSYKQRDSGSNPPTSSPLEAKCSLDAIGTEAGIPALQGSKPSGMPRDRYPLRWVGSLVPGYEISLQNLTT